MYASLHALILQSRLYLDTPNDDTRLKEVVNEHRRIVDAFDVDDGMAVVEAVRQHLEGDRRKLLKKVVTI